MATLRGYESVELAAPALRSFQRIADAWGLRPSQRRALLGGIPPSTYDRLRKSAKPALSDDGLERISHILGIYKALHVIFPASEYADRWIREPNAAFAGTPALERMLEGFTGLVDVRRYLDAQRGW